MNETKSNNSNILVYYENNNKKIPTHYIMTSKIENKTSVTDADFLNKIYDFYYKAIIKFRGKNYQKGTKNKKRKNLKWREKECIRFLIREKYIKDNFKMNYYEFVDRLRKLSHYYIIQLCGFRKYRKDFIYCSICIDDIINSGNYRDIVANRKVPKPYKKRSAKKEDRINWNGCFGDWKVKLM